MYRLISAIAKNIEDDTRWRDVEIGDMPLRDIYATYSRVIAVVKDEFSPDNMSLDLAKIRKDVGGFSSTFDQFLLANGNQTLPTSSEVPIINTRYVEYADAFHAGYDVTNVAPGVSFDAALPEAEKTWLMLSKQFPQATYREMQKTVLPIVNGFLHKTDADENGFYVQDGMKSQMLSGSNLLGLMSFRDVGTFTILPIKPEMVYRQNDRQKLRNQCFIDTGVDVSQKIVLLSLGGYLHVLDEGTLFRVSDSAFCINFNNIPLVDRYYESCKYIDLSSLNVETSTNNPDQIGLTSLFSDDSIAAYCTLSQSFFIVLDKDDIFLDRIDLNEEPGPGDYSTVGLPIYPMILGHGKLANYWYVLEDGIYAISTYDTSIDRRMYDTTKIKDLTSVSNTNDSYKSTEKSKAHFLRIGCDI